MVGELIRHGPGRGLRSVSCCPVLRLREETIVLQRDICKAPGFYNVLFIHPEMVAERQG